MPDYRITKFTQLRRYIAADLYRYMTSTSMRAYLRGWFIPGFRYCFFLRTSQYMAYSRFRMLYLPVYLIIRLILRHYQFKYGISIHHTCNIGPGLSIGHFGNIIVNPYAEIGKNCNLAPGVLLGLNFNKKTNRFEYPVIGDFVALANNAKVLGGAILGNWSMVAVSAVVTKDVPENAVVAGIPAKIINYESSRQYVGSFHPWTLQ